MRRILISILLLALVGILACMVIAGIDINGIALGYSYQDIIAKNAELDQSITSLSNRIAVEYATAKTGLDASFQKLQTEKQNYESTIAYTSEEEIQAANQSEKYKLNYLWTTIGLDATKNNLVMKSDVSYGTSGVPNQYNIAFTVTGDYLSISEFIYAIEKDSTLGFRIEEFTVVPYSEDSLQANFIIKNISIDPASLSASTSLSTGTVTTNDENTNDDSSNQNNDHTNDISNVQDRYSSVGDENIAKETNE